MNETLIQAAEYIDQYGWMQGNLSDSQGRVCMFGALDKVTRTNIIEFDEAKELLHKFIAEVRGIPLIHKHGYDNVVYLNDFILKSAEEASKVLREAAEWVPNA